jgi:hypothetical protein
VQEIEKFFKQVGINIHAALGGTLCARVLRLCLNTSKNIDITPASSLRQLLMQAV